MDFEIVKQGYYMEKKANNPTTKLIYKYLEGLSNSPQAIKKLWRNSSAAAAGKGLADKGVTRSVMEGANPATFVVDNYPSLKNILKQIPEQLPKMNAQDSRALISAGGTGLAGLMAYPAYDVGKNALTGIQDAIRNLQNKE